MFHCDISRILQYCCNSLPQYLYLNGVTLAQNTAYHGYIITANCLRSRLTAAYNAVYPLKSSAVLNET